MRKSSAVIVSIMSLARDAVARSDRAENPHETSSTGRLTTSSRDESRSRSPASIASPRCAPSAAPQLWQRGIALYYAGRYDDCRKQFESHRTVNPNDVENAGLALPVRGAGRVAGEGARRAAAGRTRPALPMREVYQMFRGDDDAGGR